MTRKTMVFLFLATAILSTLSVFFTGYFLSDQNKLENSITIKVEDIINQTLKVNNLELSPAETKEYEVNLVCLAEGIFDVTLDYYEVNDGGMKEFVYLSIQNEETSLYHGKLSNLLDIDKTLKFTCYLYSDKAYVIRFIYEMPREIGNEAQGKFVDFNINLMIEKR